MILLEDRSIHLEAEMISVGEVAETPQFSLTTDAHLRRLGTPCLFSPISPQTVIADRYTRFRHSMASLLG